MAAIVITLGGITFNATARDGNGCLYRVTAFEGWDSADVRQQALDRAGVEGEILVESYWGGRALVLDGYLLANSYNNWWAGRQALATMADSIVTADGTLVFNEPTPKQITVRLAGRLKMDAWGSDKWSRISIPLRAVDPRKYATTSTSVPLV